MSLKTAKNIPISAGPINAAAFPKVLNKPKNAPALSDGINLANKLRELPWIPPWIKPINPARI